MEKRWVLIADAGRARLLSAAGRRDRLELIQIFRNPQGMQHASELVSDGLGRVDKSCGNVMSAMEPRTDPHEQKAVEFARALADVLDEAAAGERFDELVLVAPAHFLGLLRSHLGPATAGRVVDELPKDLTRMSPMRVASYLRKQMKASTAG